MTRRAHSVAVMFLVVAACGGSKQQTLDHANKGLEVALSATNAAASGLVDWDKRAQAKIVEAATSEEEGRAALDAHRATRDTVVEAFEAAYSAIALAGSVVTLYETGKASVPEAFDALTKAATAVKEAHEAYQAIKGSP